MFVCLFAMSLANNIWQIYVLMPLLGKNLQKSVKISSNDKNRDFILEICLICIIFVSQS